MDQILAFPQLVEDPWTLFEEQEAQLDNQVADDSSSPDSYIDSGVLSDGDSHDGVMLISEPGVRSASASLPGEQTVADPTSKITSTTFYGLFRTDPRTLYLCVLLYITHTGALGARFRVETYGNGTECIQIELYDLEALMTAAENIIQWEFFRRSGTNSPACPCIVELNEALTSFRRLLFHQGTLPHKYNEAVEYIKSCKPTAPIYRFAPKYQQAARRAVAATEIIIQDAPSLDQLKVPCEFFLRNGPKRKTRKSDALFVERSPDQLAEIFAPKPKRRSISPEPFFPGASADQLDAATQPDIKGLPAAEIAGAFRETARTSKCIVTSSKIHSPRFDCYIPVVRILVGPKSDPENALKIANAIRSAFPCAKYAGEISIVL